ncbi:hypothetical protein HJ590_06340 [Naumannella sp. ID2617S]|uniref:hypothetical protein n=1 Tax=Enemella dayhoffiae TaxID=2016507 RepID=UPI001489C2C5|nr:hypothetical protein [Enemella dayhoffiae]NNG19204.1 hypothetical protein [Naumannella sp. ID2617S]
MTSVPDVVRRLRADRDNGRLADLCAAHRVDLLVLFGSAREAAEQAQDVDVAYSFQHGAEPDDLAVVNALGEAYGDLLDIMPLDRAGSVARYAALGGGEVLVELTDQKFALQQMAAFGQYVDTQRFRDLQLEALRR